MNPVDRPLLNIGLTRLEFCVYQEKALAGLIIAPALLSLLWVANRKILIAAQ